MISEIDKTTSLHLNNEAQFLCFMLEEGAKLSQLYAINVFKIREIIYYRDEVTKNLGDENGIVLGFLKVRDETIPLVDLRRWLYYNPQDPRRDLRAYSISDIDKKILVAICNFSNCTVGIKLSGLKRIVHKNWHEIYADEVGENSKVIATTEFEGEVVQILDIERMAVDAFPALSGELSPQLNNIIPIHSDKVVLIAEDSKSAAKTLKTIIDKMKLKNFVFSDGGSLLQYLYSPGVMESIGVVITDLEMPQISGFEVLKTIKENPESAHLPVIVNSSMSSDSNKQMASALKADGFITKSDPIQIQKLLHEFLEK
ncbi:chemotaxis protein CheV [Helicobacter enhydrae]|uniref:Chemotaxis protein CheV n=1 Tax=Helicobacter enhydrae TaxID=222136 RepID=A0A1B1U757_9HELI|nr:chemotaxis protein [Helicobacter enhydrae]ANV98637.1 chemotaxis protein CheV [Helicobacter enhydrae]